MRLSALPRWIEQFFASSAALLGGLALLGGPALLGGAEARADDFLVTSLADAGAGSLREAINAANASAAATKNIKFDVDPNSTITLVTDLPEIEDGVTIDGRTVTNLTIDGAGASVSRIFLIGAETTTLRDLNLKSAPLEIGTDAAVAFNLGVDKQFDEVIKDAQSGDEGRLIKQGDAMLTLRGANTYTGGTDVQAGSLRGDTTSLQGDIEISAANASLIFDQDDPGDYSDTISGLGSVQKTGTGEVHFTSGNTYAGGTTISKGALRGKAGPLGIDSSLQGDIAVASGARVIFDQASDGLYADNLSGAGSFRKEGAGELELTGTNTISGASSLVEGSLLGSYASIPRNLATSAGTTVTFDHDDDGSYAGLSGAGDFVKSGSGTLTLAGSTTITGQANLNGGALKGSVASLPASLMTAGGTTVIFDQASNGTYAGAISGSAKLTKSGAGTLTFTGAHSYTGLTTVSGGGLVVDGSLAGGLNLGASTKLGGTGSIGGPVTASGTVAPGHSIGTLGVNSITFAPGSVFSVEVDEASGAADQLVVTGNADIGGASLVVSPGGGSYATPVNVTIISAGAVLNDFASFEEDFPFLDISYLLTATTVELTILNNGEALSTFAQTPNQSTIATALEEALDAAQMGMGDPDIEDVFDSLYGLNEDQIPGALDSMTGETLTQFATTRLAIAERFGRALDARIRDHQWRDERALFSAGAGAAGASDAVASSTAPGGAPVFGVAMLGVGPLGAPAAEPAPGSEPATGSGFVPGTDSWFRTWIDGSGIYGDVDGNANESDFDYTIWGGSLGADFLLAEHWVVGLAGGYANTALDFSSRPGEGGVDTYQGALYAGYVDPRFHLGVSGRYAYNDMDGKREIPFVNRKADADLDGDDYGARFESGLNLFGLGGFLFEPTASVSYNHLTQDDYTESGAGSLNLAVEDQDLDSLVTGVGMRVHGRFAIDADFWFVPELRGRWLHEFLDTDRLIEARLTSAPAGASAFRIQGAELPRDSGSVGVAWSVVTGSSWSVTGSYDALLNDDLVQHVGSLTLNFHW